MHNVGSLSMPIFWCPRCGTLKQPKHLEGGCTYIPKLVQRCRNFSDKLEEAVEKTPLMVAVPSPATWRTAWRQCSIAEAIDVKVGDPHQDVRRLATAGEEA
jgi:hypothetical protein